MTQLQMALELILIAGELRTHMERGQQVWLETGRTEGENLFKAAGIPHVCPSAATCNAIRTPVRGGRCSPGIAARSQVSPGGPRIRKE